MKVNKSYAILFIFSLVYLSAAILIILNAPSDDDKLSCTYDSEISLQKARFDFAMSIPGNKEAYQKYYGLTYNKLGVDFLYALKYAKCK